MSFFGSFFVRNIVFARIIDTLEGRMNSLGIHIDNMKALGDQAGKEMYIFKWLSDQLDEAKLNKRHMVHFCHEISQYLPELVNTKKRAKPIQKLLFLRINQTPKAQFRLPSLTSSILISSFHFSKKSNLFGKRNFFTNFG